MRSTFSKNAFVDKRANLIVRVDNFLAWARLSTWVQNPNFREARTQRDRSLGPPAPVSRREAEALDPHQGLASRSAHVPLIGTGL